MTASWQVAAAEHFVSFVAGLLIGFVLSSRYQIVNRNGKERDG